MAATLSLDTITSSGSTITVPTGKTLAITDSSALTVGGTAISAGSSNILRKIADYTIVEADVSGKSELVIATNAAAANRTITLPAVATTGLANCIVTIICDADATSTYQLKIQDVGTTEVWTGYQKGDFVGLIVSNSAWLVVDHKETYFEHRYLTSNQAIAAYIFEKWEATTSITSIGNMYSASDIAIVAPADGFMHVNSNFVPEDEASPRTSGGLKIGATSGTMVTIFQNPNTSTDGRHTGPEAYNSTHPVTSGDLVELWFMNHDDEVSTMESGLTKSQYVFTFVRSY